MYDYTTFHGPILATQAFGINDFDQAVGIYLNDFLLPGPRVEGFFYSNGVFTTLNLPSDPHVSTLLAETRPLGINNAGQIVGTYYVGFGSDFVEHGFLYQNGVYITLDDPLAHNVVGARDSTRAQGINNLGQIVGTYDDNGGNTHSFLLSDGVWTTLDIPGTTQGTYAQGINDLGQVVGYYVDSNDQTHGFLYSNGSYTILDRPGGLSTQAFGINNAGQIVGHSFIGGSFLYSNGSYTSIDDIPRLQGVLPGNFDGSISFVRGINNTGQISGYYGNFILPVANYYGFIGTQPPPIGTTANMVMRHGADGQYEISHIGNNTILVACPLGQVGTEWAFVTLGGFFDGETSDMLLRNANTGAFQVYDISNNNIAGTAALGAVGLNWQVAGFGNFSSRGETDMMLRDANTGGFQAYDIANNQITGTAFMGTVGLDWRVGGFGNFSSRTGASDMILRNTTTGGLQVYNIDSNQITGTAFMGTVGSEWQFSGVGNFSSMPGETDMILRNTTTGALQVYDIANNQITGTAFLGTVGLEWQFAGIAPIHAPGASDLVLRNVNSGAFEVYDIANNHLTGAAPLGAVGTDWQLGGFAADPPTGSTGSSNGSTSQLVQAMADFGGGSGVGESLNTVALGSDTSQQTLLATPQHA
jgi:probable HAF family extracellular repeat protein